MHEILAAGRRLRWGGVFLILLLWVPGGRAGAQGSAAFGVGASAAAVARGGVNATERGAALDAIEGNPAGLAGISGRVLDLAAVGSVAGGAFSNAANRDASLSGFAGGLPYGALAGSLGRSRRWVASAAVTPELLLRANWHYNDAPGTAGVSYGYQQQESRILAVRGSAGLARALGPRWSAGATVGLVYNQNQLHAPYIFQQDPALAGLKVLLRLDTRGYGWNGGAGVQWQPAARVRLGLAWKSGTTIRTVGDARGSASALFNALGVPADPAFHYHAIVTSHLPQALDAGLAWQTQHHVRWLVQGDFTAWRQAFDQLPITLSSGTNSTINSVVGSTTVHDKVALQWRNQWAIHVGGEVPVAGSFVLRGGYSYATDPVPGSTLVPLTAAIMQNTQAIGAGLRRGRWVYDAACQVQLRSTKSVGQSGLLAGEYSRSRVEVWTQSLTVSARLAF